MKIALIACVITAAFAASLLVVAGIALYGAQWKIAGNYAIMSVINFAIAAINLRTYLRTRRCK